MFSIVRQRLQMWGFLLRYWGWENWIFILVVGLLATTFAFLFRHYGNGGN